MAIGGLYIELFIVIFYIRIAVVSELYHTSIFLHIRQFEKSKGYKNSLNACPQLSSAQNEMSPARMGRNPSSDQDMSTCFYLKTHGKKQVGHLEDHATNASESVDANLRGLSGC